MAEIDLIKISELPATSTIGDADELAVVQGGATKKVPYSVLKAGAEVTPDTTLSEAGVPADAAAVGAALALKANQAAVTQSLAAKADKTEVTDISGDIAELASVVETKADQTALNQKADKTTTDALRQDLTTLNGIVSQKADKTELNTQIGNVTAELATKANTADVNNLLAAKANVASPVFTGRPQAPTAAKGTATLQLATTAFVQNAIDDKQDTLTFDAAPTQGSTNPVTSGGVYTAVEDAKDEAETAIAEVREESEEATAEAKEIALKAFATPTASGQLITLTDGADGIPAKKLTLNLSPHQSGSGDPSPENVRSISGYQSVTVTRAGKNLLPFPYADGDGRTVSGVTYTVNADGSVSITGTAATATCDFYFVGGRSEYAKSGLNGTFLVRLGNYEAGLALWVAEQDGSTISVRNTPTEITFSPDKNYRIFVRSSKDYAINTTVYPMIRSAAYSDTYEKPTGHTDFDITIPTAAGTVYGGSLEINEDGSGALMVGYATLTLNGTEEWTSSNSGMRMQTILRNGAKPNTSTQAKVGAVSTYFAERTPLETYNGIIGFSIDSATPPVLAVCQTGQKDMTAESWKAYLAEHPLQIVMPITSGATYTLTAEQVTTLLGDNTLWMDADGTIDLAYRADTTLYINNLITGIRNNIAYIEDGMIASRAYTVGQFVLIGGQLYKVTASIASGATFTIGTNVTATTVGTELTALA